MALGNVPQGDAQRRQEESSQMPPSLLTLIAASWITKWDDIGQVVGVLGETPPSLVAVDAISETATVQHGPDIIVVRALG